MRLQKMYGWSQETMSLNWGLGHLFVSTYISCLKVKQAHNGTIKTNPTTQWKVVNTGKSTCYQVQNE